MASNESSRLAVNFNVKLSTGNYETEDFSLSIEQAVDPTLTRPELMVEAEELGRSVRSQVYTEAGVEFSVEDDGRVMRMLSKSVSGPTGSAAPKAAPTPRAAKPVAKAAAPAPRRGGKVNAEAAALWTHLVEVADDARSEYFDNRDRIANGTWKPTAPYFKHRKTDTKLFFSDCPDDIKGHFIDTDGGIHYETVGDFA
jgi:hypothetical protein